MLDKLGFVCWAATVVLLIATVLMWLVARDASLVPYLVAAAAGVVLTEVAGVRSGRFHR